MRTVLNLVSTFGPNMLTQPSIQLAALQAYVEREAIPGVTVHSHSAFAGVPWLAWKEAAQETAHALTEFGEYPFSLLCLEDFAHARLDAAATSLRELVDRVNQRREFRALSRGLAVRDLVALRLGVERYLAHRIAPVLAGEAINIFGFTTDFSQVYSSAYFIRRLTATFPDHRFLFILGGGAASLPETGDAFRALGIQAHCVEGEGELVLSALCQSLAALPAGAPEEDIHKLLTTHGPALHALGTHAVDTADAALGAQVPDLARLPLPSFGDYFTELGALSPSLLQQDFSLPMEGSRGCFARCTFCSNPHSWDGYRRFNGRQVVERCTELFRRHPFNYVTFVDVSCDSWAAEYARILLETGEAIPSVMQFRAHHNESYFTRLALAGVVHFQVGVEALTPNLLTLMEKGTRVVQNCLAQKYLAELRAQQWNNLITGYPGSTLDDIVETRRILSLTCHMGSYGLSPLALRAGSPLFDRALREGCVPPRDRERDGVAFPAELEVFDHAGVQRRAPAAWLPTEVAQAWSEFEDWYEEFKEDTRDVCCDVTPLLGGRVRIVDTRHGSSQVTDLAGAEARVLDACHAGPHRDTVPAATGLAASEVEQVVGMLLERRFLLETEGHLVSLPLRSRDALARNCLRDRALRQAPPGP
jgi:hypothetical protein